MMPAILLALGLSAAADPVRTTPAFTELVPTVSLPPAFEDRLIYYQSFDSPDGAPEVNVTGAVPNALELQPTGFRGRCALGPQDTGLHLNSEAFSPHRPFTASFWWALSEDAKIDGVFGLLHLAGARGFISHFSRGKGEWCALQHPVGVLQVYYLDGIANVNGIYEGDLLSKLDLRAGVWHHAAIVIRGASLTEVYTDGAKVFETRNNGRDFLPEDQLRDLRIGSFWGTRAFIDEVAIFQRALLPEEIADYVTALRQMAAVGYPQ
ncbi:MAG: LamG domain-containing protein [Armatimonadetes bacterium]|nr:LamG domain-containing protein [Armatimonadota bacterium]